MKRKKKKPGDKSPRSSLAGFYSPAKREFLQRDPSGLDVGERIRRERYLKSFTMDQMAGYLGISTSYLGAMERGARPVSKHMMHVLHDRLGLSYDYLWEGLSVTGTMISQYVHESNQYEQPIKHKIDVLINVASPQEQLACYNMIHTYLMQERNDRTQNRVPPNPFTDKEETSEDSSQPEH